MRLADHRLSLLLASASLLAACAPSAAVESAATRELVAAVAEAARARGRHVAVCGGLASDPLAVAVLLGLGVQELSVVPGVVPRIKAVVWFDATADTRSDPGKIYDWRLNSSARSLAAWRDIGWWRIFHPPR